MPDVFSIPIFFIVFREALEAVIIVAVLLSLVEGIVGSQASQASSATATTTSAPEKVKGSHAQEDSGSQHTPESDSNPNNDVQAQEKDVESSGWSSVDRAALIKKLRLQIFVGAGAGFLVALAIGAAFIAIWFTQVRDLFGENEEIWEGVFNLVASILIFVMGLTMLRMDTAKVRWRKKLEAAFATKTAQAAADGEGKSVKWVLFTLPFITVMREGLEAVVFIGGVSLGQAGTSIPLAAICGILAGLVVGFIIYKTSSRVGISIFLVISTWFLLLIGAGLFSKSVQNFQRNKFNKLVGGDVAEAGTGPGSYSTDGSIWHLNCCSPEDKIGAGGWAIFAGLFGWDNDGNLGSVLSYIFYWWAAIAALVFMKWREGRLTSKSKARTVKN